MGLLIAVDDPRAEDVHALLARHLAFAREVTPPEDVHALDIEGLVDPAVTFFSTRLDGELLVVGALYTKAGFAPCEPFGDYGVSPSSTCMTITLHPAARRA
jgi:hypothetical protein